MKTAIHPKYYPQAQVICACGNRFTTGSTMEIIHVELCNKCHPFFTGEQKYLDRASLIQSFKSKQETAKKYQQKKAEKVEKQKKRQEEPKSLREMLLSLK